MAEHKDRCGTPNATFKTRISDVPKKSGGRRAPNRFAATCHFCGTWVPAEAGCVEQDNDTGGWVVFC